MLARLLVRRVIAASDSTRANTSPASPPNVANGPGPGMTKSSCNGRPVRRPRAAVSSASSYSGSGHTGPGGSTNASRAVRPVSTSSTMRR
jgi:hypothetical protein